MSKTDKQITPKGDKTDAKKAKPVKEEKPKKLEISKVCFEAAEAGKNFPEGREGLVSHVLAVFAEAGQTTNIKGKPIEKTKVASQVNAWLADVKKERKGRWSDVTFEDSKEGLQFTKRA